MGTIRSGAPSKAYDEGWERTFGHASEAAAAGRRVDEWMRALLSRSTPTAAQIAGREVARYAMDRRLLPVVGFDGMEKAKRVLKMDVKIDPAIPEGELHLIDPVTERVVRVVNLSGIE